MVTNISSPGRQVAYIESFCLETSSPDHDGPSDLLYNEQIVSAELFGHNITVPLELRKTQVSRGHMPAGHMVRVI